MNLRKLLRALPALVLIGSLAGIGMLTSPVQIGALSLAMLLGAYLLLALLLQASCDLARQVHPLAFGCVALGVGAVLAWHVREELRVPEGAMGLALLAVGIALPYLLLARSLAPLLSSRGQAAAAVILLALAFPAYVVALYSSSNVFRWHLLRHHKLMGTPAYFAMEPGVEVVGDQLWGTHQAAEDPPVHGANPLGEGAARPNLLFVMIDTLRADAMEAYGGDPSWMPRLNAFAQESVVFTDVLANASWTRPSVASYFTGLLQEHHGAADRGDRLPESAVTLAEKLKGAGYTTAAFVANFAAAGADAGFSQGFDLFEEMESERWPYARADEMTAAASRWLREHGDQQPWFLYVHYLDPHDPYLSGGEPSARPASTRAAYEKELRYTDIHVSRMLERIDALDDSTIIFLTSDHGEEFGEHGEIGHGKSLYREVVHLPAVLQIPGVAPGEISARFEQRDFFDLILGLAGGAKSPRGFAADRDRERRYTSVYSSTDLTFYRPYLSRVVMRSIEMDGMSYIWSAYGRTEELYDLERDPEQRRNLAREQDPVRRRLGSELESHVQDWVERRPIVASERTVEMLRALGYVE